MADRQEALLSGISPSSLGVFHSSAVSTNGRRDLVVALRMPSTTGSAVADFMDFWIEQSSESAFTNSYKIALVPLYNPLTATTGQLFTQVTGNLTLPSDVVNTAAAATAATSTLLRQTYQINITTDTWIRVGYRVQGTAASFTNVNLYLFSNTVP